MKNSITKNSINKLLVIIFWFIIWQIAAVIINQPLYLPSVTLTFKTLANLIVKPVFIKSVAITMLRVFAGLVLSFFFGMLFAIFSSKSKLISAMLSPFLSTMKAIPTMSIIILALVWISTTLVPVFVCFLLCFPIVYTNTLNGIKNIDNELIEMCNIYNISVKKRLKEIIMPSIVPYIFSSLMICIGLAWKSVIAAEVLSAPKVSMGYNLYTTKMYLDIPELFAWTVAVVAFSIIIEKIVKKAFSKRGVKVEH